MCSENYAEVTSMELVKAYFKSWLFAVLGSPTMQTLMSPRRLVPSPVTFGTPPNNMSKIPRFTSSFPVEGGQNFCKFSKYFTKYLFMHEFTDPFCF